MPIYPRNQNKETTQDPSIPSSIYSKAVEKDTLEWLYKNVSQYEKKYGIPPGTMLSLAGHESGNYQKGAVSKTGPIGLFQFTEKTAKDFGLVVTPELDERLDLAKATDAAARLLAANMKEHGGDIVKALAQYNGGGAAVKFLDGRTHEFDSKNGNPGELYGFMRGVANYAKEWGNEELYNKINPTYKDFNTEVIRRKEAMVAKGIKVDVTGQWGKKDKEAWDNAIAQHADLNPASGENEEEEDIPFDTGLTEFERKAMVSNPIKNNNQEKPSVSEKDPNWNKGKAIVPKEKPVDLASEKARAVDEIRIYQEGGKLAQLQGNGTTGGDVVPLQGEERIYSIRNTKQIATMAIAADSEKKLIALGEYVYKATKKQDERPQEFTKD